MFHRARELGINFFDTADVQGISAKEGLARFEMIEPMYNLVKRQAEVEILPLAHAENMGVITYSPLGAGLLTGKYGAGKRPESAGWSTMPAMQTSTASRAT